MSLATRDDVIACYRNILGREPESEAMINRRVGLDLWTIIREISHSLEHGTKIARHSCHSLQKFERPYYLAKNLSREKRASALFYNYSELRRLLRAELFIEFFERGLAVLENLEACPSLRVYAHLCDNSLDEGEITLIMSIDNHRLAYISFTLVDAVDFGLNHGSALLISRIQGCPGAAEQAKIVSKNLGGITLPHLLISVVEGIAASLEIKSIIGVQACNHPSFTDGYATLFVQSYDDLFISLGAGKLSSGFFHYGLPRAPRPLEGGLAHRSRRRARRAVRQAIMQKAATQWGCYLRTSAF